MAAAEDGPVGPSEAAALLAPLADAGAVGLAVSGGPDSLALLHLAAGWSTARGEGPRLVVFHVDHRLRIESAAAAAVVAEAAARCGLPAETLVWEGPHPETGLERAAREARYALLVAAATRAGVTHLVTAHHRDDQAETFLMRLARGSGIDGLAGMAPARPLAEGLTLFRPFLAVPRSRLLATCREAGLAPVDDPMNRDPRYARARLRRLAPALAAEGLDAAALARAADRMRRASIALEAIVDRLLARAAAVGTGAAEIELGPLLAEPEEIRLRALERLVRAVGGGAPRAERLAAIEAEIAAGRCFRRTLGGALIASDGSRLRLAPEPPRRRQT